ncbi:MAG: S-adenosylmethionine:tRNA ribosyltransferase-isomerase, partial [Ignavibacteria bacterium]|nr:S-adenosylmethionine:tRNA ribosyltransferase-isomerase [Ignavibacteria bacterium]
PTAGLHFTDNVLDSLKQKNIDSTYITLHVGAGTFKPVKSEIIAEHQMHSESFSVGKDTIEKIIQALKRESKIISIGTTTMRTVESLYWFGIQLNQNRHHSGSDVFIPQWEPYEFHSELPASDALSAVLNYMDMNSLDLILGRTSIIIVPGYDFKIFGGLITNFHQPGSTLLLLVAAFMGSDWKVVYDYALNNGFRFLSYGDSSILFR